ncbi:triple tyrosine motif-containing protein [Clostridium polynesiense]|uniref:triple tyrosine motif-containing protein n=1 Tax=Clostridium polynesiense TaxID=1325933 RepID=UPI00058C4C03|nr:triple tyrosine motif-containing protein [Clostridium polynesiense]
MKELEIILNRESPQKEGSEIELSVVNSEADYLYKFNAGIDGIWTTIQDFSKDSFCLWKPQEDGKYTIMVQGRDINSKKPFDAAAKFDYIIGSIEENLIQNVFMDRRELLQGEKINVLVETSVKPVMYKYWISGRDGWELIKDYTSENEFIFTANEPGKHEILVECKTIESKNNFDDFKTVSFLVSEIEKAEITDFKCLTSELLTEEELVFQVESKQEDSRMVLYKFIKIDPVGKALCIQDYSTKRMVSFREKKPGSYKLLCFVKDMYSLEEYDDRAIMFYDVKPYNPIVINSFTTDFISPQATGTKILLKALVSGGRNLLYKYKIEGNHGEDSGYIRNNSYIWKAEHPGDYKVTLYVKDESCPGEYEASSSLEYVIAEKAVKSVKIKEVALSRERDYIKNKPINITVVAEGGTELRYSFLVYKGMEEIERMGFGSANWVNFIPKESGEYQMEIRVKDKYSNKDYDSHTFLYFNVKDYIKASIDYVLIPSKEYYMVEDDIEIEVITKNTQETLIKYSISINDHLVEETQFIKSKRFKFTPKVSGKYSISIYSKNLQCRECFDDKKEVKLYIHEALPVTGTKIKSSKVKVQKNEEISFVVQSEGGKEVCYEFYLMENSEWKLMQKYSRKNYYTLIPFLKGVYKVLVLSRSFYKKAAYEDYDIFEFEVN